MCVRAPCVCVCFTFICFYLQGPAGPQGPLGYPGPRGVKVGSLLSRLFGVLLTKVTKELTAV